MPLEYGNAHIIPLRCTDNNGSEVVYDYSLVECIIECMYCFDEPYTVVVDYITQLLSSRVYHRVYVLL
jgi:hypothetical protein